MSLKLEPTKQKNEVLIGGRKTRTFLTSEFKNIIGEGVENLVRTFERHKTSGQEIDDFLWLMKMLCACKLCTSTRGRQKLLAEAQEYLGKKWFDELSLKPIVLKEEQNGLSIIIVTEEGIPETALSEGTDFGIKVCWVKTNSFDITNHIANLAVGSCNSENHNCINDVILI